MWLVNYLGLHYQKFKMHSNNYEVIPGGARRYSFMLTKTSLLSMYCVACSYGDLRKQMAGVVVSIGESELRVHKPTRIAVECLLCKLGMLRHWRLSETLALSMRRHRYS